MVISRGVKTSPSESSGVNRFVANRYRIRKKLGQGQYGVVYLVEDENAPYNEEKLKVLKEIPVTDMPPDETIDAMREAKLQSRLDHAGVVRCHNNFLDQNFFCIISEYCDCGDLESKITHAKKSGTCLPEWQILDWFCQIILATHYMHQKQILHRDLKPRNIFIKDNCCKLGDFGISRVLMGTADMASTFIGTPYYMSPEVLKHEGYDSKSDMWSLGVILFEMCTLEHCFDGQSLMSVLYKITQGKIPRIPAGFSPGVQTIFQGLVERRVKRRMSATQVLLHPFIQQHLQKMKRRMQQSWIHAIDKTLHIVTEGSLADSGFGSGELDDGAAAGEDDGPNVDLNDEALAENGGGQEDDPEGAAEDTLAAENAEGLDENEATVKTAAQLAHERKLQRQREQERMIMEATKSSYVENYKHRNNVRKLFKSDFERSQAAPEPPVMPKPTRIASPDSLAPRRVATSEGRPNYAVPSPPPSDDEGQDEGTLAAGGDSGFNSVNVSGEKQETINTDSWNNRPITAKNKLFEEILEEELRKSRDAANPPSSGLIPKKPFKPLKKGGGKQAYNASGPKKGQKKSRRRRAGDEADGDGYDMLLEYEDDFEDYIESEDEDESDGADKSGTVVGDSGETPLRFVDAFSPSVRSVKISNMRKDCISKMGRKQFDIVYKYLQSARGDPSKSENQILARLSEICPNRDNAFVVDQLLFLETTA